MNPVRDQNLYMHTGKTKINKAAILKVVLKSTEIFDFLSLTG